MNIFFHHVGKQGAEEDFPKTIFNQVEIGTVQNNISDELPLKKVLIDDLLHAFPSKKFNVWGVPAGAAKTIKKLSIGDYVFFVESISNSVHSSGSIPALGKIEVFHYIELPQLSSALWGRGKYVYLFFFNTIEIDLTWDQFCSYLGYKENYDPRGLFCPIAENRFELFGGADSFIKQILKKQPPNEFRFPEEIIPSKSEPEINDRIFNEGDVTQITINAHERNSQARLECIRFYKNEYKCIICGFRFIEHFGIDGENIIHIHHIKPLGNSYGPYKLNPISDLVPVCPNCHAFIHSKNPPYSIEEVQNLLKSVQ